MSTARKLFSALALAALLVGGLRAEDDKCKDKPGYVGIMIKADESNSKAAVVQSVIEDGPAAKAGLKVDDVIIKIDGKEFDGLQEFVEKVRAHKPGDEVKLTIKRDGKEQEIKIKAGASPQQD